MDDYLRSQGLAPCIAVDANTISALIEVVRHSDVITMLPEAIGVQHADLHNVAITPEPQPRTATLLYRRGVYRSAVSLAFTGLCRELYSGSS